MELLFENKMGTLKLSGRGSDGFSVCQLEGIDLPEKARTLKSYIGEDGQVEESSQYGGRVISISGDIKCLEGFRDSVRRAMRILSYPGSLTIESGGVRRVIHVNSASLTFGKSYDFYRTFVILFTCDYPHFKDTENSSEVIFKRINYLGKDSVFPLVLSERISEGTVNNNGDIRLYPVIKIVKKSDTVTQSEIKIGNLTTGKNIVLNKTLAIDEEIVINVRDRTITSSVDGNIMGSLSLYSSLSELWLDCGENIVSVTVNGSRKGIFAKVLWVNEYTQMF